MKTIAVLNQKNKLFYKKNTFDKKLDLYIKNGSTNLSRIIAPDIAANKIRSWQFLRTFLNLLNIK